MFVYIFILANAQDIDLIFYHYGSYGIQVQGANNNDNIVESWYLPSSPHPSLCLVFPFAAQPHTNIFSFVQCNVECKASARPRTYPWMNYGKGEFKHYNFMSSRYKTVGCRLLGIMLVRMAKLLNNNLQNGSKH